MSGPIPVRVAGATSGEPEDVLRHPARQARLGYRAMVDCDPHSIDHTGHCQHCRAPDWAIMAHTYRPRSR